MSRSVVVASGLSVFLLLLVWHLRTPASFVVIASTDHPVEIFAPGDPNVLIHADGRRVVSRGKPPDRFQYYVGGGGRLLFTLPLEGRHVNRVTVRLRPLNDFSIHCLALQGVLEQAGDASGGVPMTNLIAARWTDGPSVTMRWTTHRPLRTAALEVPHGADFVLESVEFASVPVANPALPYLMAAALIVPALLVGASAVYSYQTRAAPSRLVFLSCWVANAIATLVLASVGHSFALESYRIDAQIVNDGQVVYAHTPRYNYGVIWSYVVAGVMQLHDALGMAHPEAFHVLAAAGIWLGTFGIGVVTSRLFCPLAGIIYALLPPLLLLTGFHSEFGNVAIATGFLSWVIILSKARRQSPRYIVLAAILLALSLSIKHFFFFLPLWVMLWRGFGPFRLRFLYAAVAYSVFAAQFLAVSGDPFAREGMMRFVFGYLHPSWALVPRLFRWLLPAPGYAAVAAWHVPTVIWVAAMVVLGYLFGSLERPRFLPAMYLVAFVALLPSVSDAYFTAPLIACAALYRCPASWAYVLLVTVSLLASPFNIGALPSVGAREFLDKWSPIHAHRGDVQQLTLMGVLACGWLRVRREPRTATE